MNKCKSFEPTEIVYKSDNIGLKEIKYATYYYKGFLIYKNYRGSKYGSEYFTIVNEKKCDKEGHYYHVHCNSKEMAALIIDCYFSIKNNRSTYRYSRFVKNKALRLLGIYIKS
jgi:hypothetical protein